jgi:hypothetical protein
MTCLMREYYFDKQKYAALVRPWSRRRLPCSANDLMCYDVPDRGARQTVGVSRTISGVSVRPEKKWSPLCMKLFLKEKANSLYLGGEWCPWDGDLSFINELPQCKNLTVGYQSLIDLSVLAGNPYIEALQLEYWGNDPGELDLASLPNLKQCQIPAHRNFMSVLKCSGLISLAFYNGKHDGILNLEPLTTLEELICTNVSKLKGAVLNPRVRLRALVRISVSCRIE